MRNGEISLASGSLLGYFVGYMSCVVKQSFCLEGPLWGVCTTQLQP